MVKRRKFSKTGLAASWTRTPEFKAATGRTLVPGMEFSVHGERGRFRFIEHVVTDKGREWIEAVGGVKGVSMLRAFRPERVKRVHRTRTVLSGKEAILLARAKSRARKGVKT